MKPDRNDCLPGPFGVSRLRAMVPGRFSRMSGNLWACMLGIVFAVPVAQAQHVHTKFDHKAPFTNYHKFSFHKIQTVNPLDQSGLRDEVRNDPQYHGWREVPHGAIAVVGEQKDAKQYQTFYDGLDPDFGWGGMGSDSTTTVRDISIGTLVVNVYDKNTHNLVWRGVSHETETSNMNKNTGKLQKAMDEMFYKFPPKGAQ